MNQIKIRKRDAKYQMGLGSFDTKKRKRFRFEMSRKQLSYPGGAGTAREGGTKYVPGVPCERILGRKKKKHRERKKGW